MTGNPQRHAVPRGSDNPQDLVRVGPRVARHQRIPEHEPRHLSPHSQRIPDSRRIRRRGRSTPPISSSRRQVAGSSRCRGMGTRTPLTFGMSGTGDNSGTGHARPALAVLLHTSARFTAGVAGAAASRRPSTWNQGVQAAPRRPAAPRTTAAGLASAQPARRNPCGPTATTRRPPR